MVPVNSRSPKWTGGWVPKKRETASIRSAGAVDDQKWSKIARPKITQFSAPSKRTGGLTGTKKQLP